MNCPYGKGLSHRGDDNRFRLAIASETRFLACNTSKKIIVQGFTIVANLITMGETKHHGLE